MQPSLPKTLTKTPIHVPCKERSVSPSLFYLYVGNLVKKCRPQSMIAACISLICQNYVSFKCCWVCLISVQVSKYGIQLPKFTVGLVFPLLSRVFVTAVYAAISKKVVIVNSRILEPKGTLGIVVMSDNAPAKVVTVWLWHYDEPALDILQSQC